MFRRRGPSAEIPLSTQLYCSIKFADLKGDELVQHQITAPTVCATARRERLVDPATRLEGSQPTPPKVEPNKGFADISLEPLVAGARPSRGAS